MINMDELIVKDLLKKKDYYRYLKENSEWVKLLKRDKLNYKNFIKYIKKKYKLRVQDKVENVFENLEVLSSVLSNIN